MQSNKNKTDRRYNEVKKGLKILALAVVLVFAFSSIAAAAQPATIYYTNAQGEVVKADVDTLKSFKDGFRAAQNAGRQIVVELSDGVLINWTAAADAGKNFTEASNYKADSVPTAVKELNSEGEEVIIGDPGDPGLPTATVTVKQGLTAFQRLVEVSLDTDNPENYIVTVMGKELQYKSTSKLFVGIVNSSDEAAIRASVEVEEKQVVVLPTATVNVKQGLTAFQRLVEVSLDTDNPENYTVTVMGKELAYKSTSKVFVGMVNSSDEAAIKADVIVALK